MFPSSNNINNCLHPSFSPTYFNQSSTTSSSSSLFGHGSDANFFLQPYYHHHHFPPGQFVLACVPETAPTETALSNIDSTNLMPKRYVKKDRHSKIYTSQGLRDRRVRLSIGIARQFFDLQELLGFDKASNTIEWLLTKSRKAIRKLAESKASSTGGARSSSSGNSEYEMVSESDEEVEEVSDQDGLASRNELRAGIEASREEMGKCQKAATMPLLAKKSRAKARERDKERPREKIQLGELKDSPDPISNQARSSACGFEGGESLKDVPEFENPITSSRDHTVEESAVIARKIRQAPSMNYPQTWMLSKDLNSSSYLSCMPQNWDINGSTIHPTFAALSSINSLAEHQSYEKPWEAQNNGI